MKVFPLKFIYLLFILFPLASMCVLVGFLRIFKVHCKDKGYES